MKYFKILAILFSSVLTFYACNDTAKSSKQETEQPMKIINLPPPPNAATPNPATPAAAQNASGVWHYTCSKGCTGGAGSAVNCSICGGLLAHNAGYHANTNNTPNANPFNTPPAASGQNIAGVWHYTCGKGCAGGSGTAGTCNTCGSTLAHNTAYHQ